MRKLHDRYASADRALAAYGHLPLTFVENRGQTDKRVRFHAQGTGQAVYLTRDEIALTLQKDSGKGVALALRFLGADPAVVPAGDRRAPGTTNYLVGDDSARWRTRVPGYLGVVYRDLWPGIDLKLTGQPGELKYEFHVRPGARVADIQLAYELAADEADVWRVRANDGSGSPGPWSGARRFEVK